MDYQSLYSMFQEVTTINGAKPAFKHKRDGDWFELTWSEVRDAVERVSKALIALEVQKGDRICILGKTRLEWILCDFGIFSCGAVTVGIYPANLPPDCAYIINHSDAEIIFVEDAAQLAKVLEVRAELPQLRQIVIFDGESDPENDVLSWDDFQAKSLEVTDEEADRRGEEIEPEDLASIVYTSGTTGVPKGAMITHRNLVFVSWSALQALSVEPHHITLLFLPLAHVFARLIVYVCLQNATTTALAEDITTVPQNMAEIRPHWIASVPRIYEKAYDKITSNVEEAGGLKLKLFRWAVRVGTRVSQHQQEKRPIPGLLKLQHRIAHKLVLHKVSDIFGGRMEWAVSGAAPLNKAIAEFFHACGVLIVEGIGMTENTSFSHVNRTDNNRFGTVGQPGPEIEHRIAEDGELLTRGAHTMKGYFKNPEATAETIDADGWLHTGDVGEIDDDGFLRITDRKKDLIITAGGKNVAPQRIERIMRTSHYIGQVVACGDRRKYLTALVTLDPDNMTQWASQHGLAGKSLEELAEQPEVRQLIEHDIEERNRELASYETVKRFHIVPHDFTVESGELTASMKIKRPVVVAKYEQEIEALYEE